MEIKEAKKYKKIRTDLAMEIKEQYENDNVEIKGVEVEKSEYDDSNIIVTTVKIMDENGAKFMKRPIGTYTTVEAPDIMFEKNIYENTIDILAKEIKKLIDNFIGHKRMPSIFIAGLGNREVTPDMLGPLVVDKINVTRFVYMNKKEEITQKINMLVSAISPGVMAQTGMEAADVLGGIINDMKPDLLIVIDALAARNLSRLNTTIQITDTGIIPGSGVGNHRKAITPKYMNIPVIAIGVPTVVDAYTIINDIFRKYIPDKTVIDYLMDELIISDSDNMIVTPRNIDENVRLIADAIAKALNIIIG